MNNELKMGITAKRKNRYVSGRSYHCLNPKCDSQNIEGGDIDVGCTMMWQNITCLDCGLEWDDIYEMAKVEVTHIPEEDKICE